MIKLVFKSIALMCCCAYLLAWSAPAFAESDEERRRERIERLEQLKRTEEVTGAASRIGLKIAGKLGWLFDYGGTARYTYTGGDENDHSGGTQDSLEFTKDYELNWYLNMVNLTRTSKFYTRLRTTYTERKKNAGATRGNEWKEMEVDLMYFEREYKFGPVKSTLTLGRMSVSAGRGIAYSGAADGIRVKLTQGRIDWKGFLVAADRSPDDYDPGNLSPPNRGNTHRRFAVTEFKYNLHSAVRPYIFYANTTDKSTKQRNDMTGEIHLYEPRFLGLGGSGSITPQLSYFGEVVHVRGKTTSKGDKVDTTPVDSRGYHVGATFSVPGPRRTQFSVEHAFASGDEDRQTTVNSTNLGNRSGADNVFRPFGGISTGYALAPSFANIQMNKYSVSLNPFPMSARDEIKSIRFTTDVYQFRKHKPAGPFSDLSLSQVGTDGRKGIGFEYDMNVTCQVFSDVSLDLRFGKFIPGATYGVTTNSVRLEEGGDPEIYMRLRVSLDL